MALFTPRERERLREELIELARGDPDIAGAAHTGSFATGRTDRWSDIDVALCVAPAAEVQHVIARWTERIYRDHRAAAHYDVWRGATLFRVFLLENTLQVDLAFWEASAFGAIGPSFQLLFGTARPQPPSPAPAPGDFIGMAWLYALHVRSSIARGRLWQAEYMVSGMRDQILSLACLRHQVPPHQGRGLDDLPQALTRQFEPSLVRSLDAAELRRAFGEAIRLLRSETAHADADLAMRLASPLELLGGGGA